MGNYHGVRHPASLGRYEAARGTCRRERKEQRKRNLICVTGSGRKSTGSVRVALRHPRPIPTSERGRVVIAAKAASAGGLIIGEPGRIRTCSIRWLRGQLGLARPCMNSPSCRCPSTQARCTRGTSQREVTAWSHAAYNLTPESSQCAGTANLVLPTTTRHSPRPRSTRPLPLSLRFLSVTRAG